MAGKAPTGSDHSGFATVETEDHQMKLADVVFETSKSLFFILQCAVELLITLQQDIVYVMSLVCITSDSNWTK